MIKLRKSFSKKRYFNNGDGRFSKRQKDGKTAKFEQMITHDEYDACIKGCQTASRETKTTFTSSEENVKEEDIYVAGGENSLWHLEGKSWRKIEFPSARPQSICGGGDG